MTTPKNHSDMTPSGQLYGTAHVGSGERWQLTTKNVGIGASIRWVDGRVMVREAAGWCELRGLRKWLWNRRHK